MQSKIPAQCELTDLGVVPLREAHRRAASYASNPPPDASFMAVFSQNYRIGGQPAALLVLYTPLVPESAPGRRE